MSLCHMKNAHHTADGSDGSGDENSMSTIVGGKKLRSRKGVLVRSSDNGCYTLWVLCDRFSWKSVPKECGIYES